MSRGGRNNPRGATRYWVITAVIAWLLLMLPPPIDLLGLGWIAYRVGKYFEKRRKEASKVTSRLNTRLVNLMLKNNKQLINAEITDEDDKYIKVVDASGRELMVDKSYVAVIEPIPMDPMD